ncbi:PfkB family carbohydrate kinase [Halovenus salina]|uniref:PfkB family carbohydrate kinase n=1 Tax=Halovenus salina TaxID=1510225 RepID=A0ABD5W2E1_9EURY|nr:PfkB family carbohydrate kinase [Halovenus salina]
MDGLVTFGETPVRLSPPEHGRVEMTETLEVYADGTESNAAIAASSLGTDTAWVSKVPDTAIGRNVTRQIAATGVETAVTWTDDSYRQGLSFREAAAPPRESRYWYDRDDTALASAQPGEFPIERMQDASLVYTAVSSAVLSSAAADTAEAILRASAGSGTVTAVELDYTPGLASSESFKRAFEGLADEVDVLITTEDAVVEVLGETGSPRELTNTLSAIYDLQMVVIRRADGSAIALHDTPGTNVVHERTAIETETVDPMGESSAFTGGLLHELVQGSDAARALSVAVASSVFAKTVPGPFLSVDGAEIESLTEQVDEQSR